MSDRESGDEQTQGAARASASSSVHSAEDTKGAGEQELATRTLHIQSKRFYLDVKSNRRGRFIKIAEVIAGGNKIRLLMTMSTAFEFRDYLTDMSDFYASLGPSNPENAPEDGRLKSESIVTKNRERRYYLDLRENARGRFLKVTQIARFRPRASIALPAQGMIEFRDALTDLLDAYGTEDQESIQFNLPEPKLMRAENKKFYFDVDQNNRGVYLRISEVRSNCRTSITIPEKAWSRFRDIMAEYCEGEVGGEGEGEVDGDDPKLLKDDEAEQEQEQEQEQEKDAAKVECGDT